MSREHTTTLNESQNVRRLALDWVAHAFRTVGLATENRPVTFPEPIRVADGWWTVTVDLPVGTTPGEVIERRDALAKLLGMAEESAELVVSADPHRAGRVAVRFAPAPTFVDEEPPGRFVPVPSRPRWTRVVHRAGGVLGTFVLDWAAACYDVLLTWGVPLLIGYVGVMAGMLGAGVPWRTAHDRTVPLGWVALGLLAAAGVLNMLRHGRDVGRRLKPTTAQACVDAAVLGAIEQRLTGVEQLAVGRLDEVVDELRGINDHLYDLRADRGQR
jgi:hypothetical protein